MAKKAKVSKSSKKVTRSKKSKPQRRKTVRDRLSFAGLNGRFFSKIKQEFHDIDYASQLSDKEKAWLASYMEEFLGARFNHTGRKFVKSKSGKQEIYNENNARQRDQYSIARATGRMVDITPEVAIAMWQERYVNHESEDMMTAVEEDNKPLSLKEYITLSESGAIIPDEFRLYYEALYFDELKLLKKLKA
jgi:hypothetical protein